MRNSWKRPCPRCSAGRAGRTCPRALCRRASTSSGTGSRSWATAASGTGLRPRSPKGAGHFGYFIGRIFCGRGYATEALRLLLDIARDLVPEEEFFLRVNKDNPASLRVMLRNGAYIHHEDDARFYVRIPKNK